MFTNPGFWVMFFILLSCTYALFMFLPNTWKGRIAVLIIGAICVFAVSTMLYKTAQAKPNTWNNGYCECGYTKEFSAIMK